MPKEVKFTEEELTQVKNIQQGYLNLTNQFGQLQLTKIRLDEQEIELKESLNKIKSEEKIFLDGITNKYGQGNLNAETGVFTPIHSSKDKSQ